jgi:glycosyltransferase involved in cell wall biosynthesis
VFPSFSVGGVENRIIRVAQALRGKYRHTVIALDGNFEAAAGLGGDPIFDFKTAPVVKSSMISPRNLAVARSTLRGLRPDLLLTYNWGSTEWAFVGGLVAHCRHLHFESGFGPDESAANQLWRRAKARAILLARCDRIVVPSLVLKDLAVRVWRLPSEKIRYIPNGVDCTRFARPADGALAASLGLPGGAPVVGTVCGLRKEKNLGRLIRVFAALPSEIGARLVIVGGGPERAGLASAAEDLGVASRVVFAGPMPDPERILGFFDVFALTSDTEQMPNSVLEAMAAGLAVAATDVGDVRYMLAPENAAFVAPVDDEGALNAGLARLLRDRDLRSRIGSANQARVHSEFALDRMAEQYDLLYSGRL